MTIAAQIEPTAARPATSRRDVAGCLMVPNDPVGLVIFAHGSSSCCLRRRNVMAAELLNNRGFATLMFELVDPNEDELLNHPAAVDVLARRIVQAVRWIDRNPRVACLPVGLFATGAGVAGALAAAAELPLRVGAILARGGRPDHAGAMLEEVAAPTMLMVGGGDPEVLAANVLARRQLRGDSEVRMVAGGGAQFEDDDSVFDTVAVATEWFRHHLASQQAETLVPA